MFHASSDGEDVQDEFDIIFNSLEIETILCDIELSALDLFSDGRDNISDIPPRKISKRKLCSFCWIVLKSLSVSVTKSTRKSLLSNGKLNLIDF
ncbi:hypothetical protein ACHWQZ_G011274 [Mnemiopsis leidyi]